MRLFQIFKIALDNIEHAKTSITDFNYRKVPIKRPWALAAQAQKKIGVVPLHGEPARMFK